MAVSAAALSLVGGGGGVEPTVSPSLGPRSIGFTGTCSLSCCALPAVCRAGRDREVGIWRPVAGIERRSINKGRRKLDKNEGRGGVASVRRCGVFVVRAAANQSNDDAGVEISADEAYKMFGLTDEATFDDILRAKKRLIATVDMNTDPDRALQIEAAYDVILMRSLQKRQSGKVADLSVRYADVKKPPSLTNKLPPWAKTAVSDISVKVPPQKELLTRSALYGGLAMWSLASGLQSSEFAVATGSDVPGAQVAIALGFAFFFLREKRKNAGSAALLTALGLLAGAATGGLLQSWLRVDIVPIGGLESPSTFVAEFVIVALYFTCTFLK